MDAKLQSLVEYIAREVEAEPLSGMIPGSPIWSIQAIPLLDQICKIWQISEDEMSALVDAVPAKKRKERW